MNLEQVHTTLEKKTKTAATKGYKKIVAVFLAVLLILQEAVFATPSGNFISGTLTTTPSAISDLVLPRARVLEGIFARLHLPAEFGKIDNFYWGDSRRTVIHIRDLHINTEAQHKIARIIQRVSERYGVRLVLLEGTSGELAHGLLSRYPDRKARVLTGRAFLNEGKMTGPEYLAVTRNPGLILYGVENQELYEQNRAALLKAVDLGHGLKGHLEDLRENVKTLAVRIFQKNIRDWIKNRELFQNNQQSIADYARFLKQVCEQENLPTDTPQLRRLLKLEKIESRLRREGRFKNEIELARYLETVLKQEGGLDAGIFDEIKQIEKTLEAHWFMPPSGLPWDLTSPVSQAVSQLYKLFRILEVYKKMFALSLTREDVEFLYQNREDFDPYALSDALSRLGHRYSLEISTRAFPFMEFEAALEAYEDFYKLALARDETLMTESLKSMKHYHETIAVLVTGGFHTPAIEERLKKEGYNFCTITPALQSGIDFAKDKKLYFRAMQMPQSPVARYAGAGDPTMQLQVPSLFPVKSAFGALGTKLDLPRWMVTYDRAGDLATMMIALAATGLRRAVPGLQPRLQSAFNELSPEEQVLAGIYRRIHGVQTLARSLDARTGSAVVPFTADMGFGLEFNWRPAPFGSAASENPRRQSFSFVTPDGVRSEVRILTEPLLADIAGRNFLRAAQKQKFTSAAAPLPSREPAVSMQAKVRQASRVRTTRSILVNSNIPVPVKTRTPAVKSPGQFTFSTLTVPSLNPLPELAALALTAALSGGFGMLPWMAVLIRLSWFSSIFAHGFGHVLFKWIVDQNHPFDLRESLEGISAREFWTGLIPFTAIYTPGLSAKIPAPVSAGERDAKKISFKALGGPALNLFGAAAAAFLLFSTALSGPAAAGLYTALIFNTLFAALSWSDYMSWAAGSAPWGFACGYLDYVGPRLSTDDKSLVPEDYIESIYNSTRILSGRGNQAYGFQSMALDRNGHVVFLGLKDVNPKRAVLHSRLRGDLKREVLAARRDGFRPLEDLIEYSSHLRFGTSTPPSKKETHPHPSPELLTTYYDWTRGTKEINARNANFQISVRHNGDNDGTKEEEQILEAYPIYAFGKEMSYKEIRRELSRILYEDTTQGDSPVIASMLALYATQGRWGASARLAYLMMAGSLGESFKGLSHPKAIDKITQRWGDIFDAEFQRFKTKIFTQQKGRWVPDRTVIAGEFLPALHQSAAARLRGDKYLGALPVDVLSAFIESAVFAFLHQDTYRAIQMLMATSLPSSTFGLSVSSTLEPKTKFWVAKGQPGALGHNPDTGAFIAASDPGAVFEGLNERSRFLTFNDDQGEIIRLDMSQARAPVLNIFSMAAHRELSPQEIQARWVAIAGNPYIQLPPSQDGRSNLKRDLEELNDILINVNDSFDARYRASRKAPSNRITADRFNTALIEIARQKKNRDDHEADILFIAEGPSYDLLQRKIQDLKSLAPGIRVHVVQGNQYMENKDAYYSGIGSAFKIGKETIVFSVSQSGMTFSNVEAVRDAEIMRKNSLLKDVFVMTGEWFSVLGRSLGQDYFPDSDFSGRIFSNMSGRRYSEAATMADATDFFLTKLLIDAFKNLAAQSPADVSAAPLFGVKLSVSELNRLEANIAPFLHSGIAKITGRGAHGREVRSPENEGLLLQGQDIANHISEQFFATSMVRFYTFVSTQLSLPVFKVLALLFTMTALWATGVESFSVLLQNISTLEMAMFFGVWFIAHEADAFFYTWQDKFFIYLIRFMQGREIMARTGSRFLAIGGPYWSLLRDYFRAALLEAPAGLQLAGVDGRETAGDFVHRFKDSPRGTLVLIQTADPENATTAQDSAAGAWKMAMSQLDGVRNFNVGPYILANTTNPKLAGRYKARTVAVSAPAVQAPDDIDRMLNVRWFEELKLLVSGQVIAAEMAEKLSKIEVPFYVRRSESAYAYLLQAFLGFFSRIYSALVLRANDFMMQNLFRAAPYDRMFTPGKGQSGLTVFTTQINAPRPNKTGETKRDIRAIAHRLMQEGIDTSMPWLPKAGVFAFIYADLYNPASERNAAPVVAIQMPEILKSVVKPQTLQSDTETISEIGFDWGGSLALVMVPPAARHERFERPPVKKRFIARLPAAVPQRGEFAWGSFEQPAGGERPRSEMRNAVPRVEVIEAGRRFILTLPASSGAQIQDLSGRTFETLTFDRIDGAYQTADGGMTASLDAQKQRLVFLGTRYGFADIRGKKAVVYKQFNLPLESTVFEHLQDPLRVPQVLPLPPSISPPTSGYSAPLSYAPPLQMQSPIPRGLLKISIMGVLIAGAVLAFSEGWIPTAAASAIATFQLPWTSSSSAMHLAYGGGLTAAGLLIVWETRDRSTRSSRMAWTARLRGWLFRSLFVGFFPVFGYAILAFELAPLPVLAAGLWLFYGTLFAGAFVFIWALTVMSLPFRRWLPPAVASWFSFKKDVAALLGVAFLAAAGYLGAQSNLAPSILPYLQGWIPLQKTSTLPEENHPRLTAPLAAVHWPAPQQQLPPVSQVPRRLSRDLVSLGWDPAAMPPGEPAKVTRPSGPRSFEFLGVTPLLYEGGDDKITTVFLLAQKEGYLEMDPRSGIRAADWQNPGKAFVIKGPQPLLRYRRPVTETEASALRELIERLKEVDARYEHADAALDRRIVPLKTRLANKEAVITEIINHFEVEQQNQVFGTLLAPFRAGEEGWILPGKRALGSAVSGTALARFQSQNRLTVRVAVPLSVWKDYDLTAMRVGVTLEGQEQSARIVHLTAEPRLDAQMILTLELFSKGKIFTWNTEENGPAHVRVRLEMEPRRGPVSYSQKFDADAFVSSYAEIGTRVRFPVNTTGAYGRTRFNREELRWVKAQERIGGVRTEDRALLNSIVTLTDVFEGQADQYLTQLRELQSPFAPTELTRFEKTRARIKTFRGQRNFWDYEAPQTGILTGTFDSEGQAFHDRPAAEIITPQIFIRHRIEKRIPVKTGDIVLVRRAATGEETLGIVRQVRRELTDKSRGEDQSRFQEISIELNNAPSLWLGDHEYGVEVLYAAEPDLQARLRPFYKAHEEKLTQEYGRDDLSALAVVPFEFVSPALEGDRQLLIDLLEKPAVPQTPARKTGVFPQQPAELIREQSGEVEPAFAPSASAEINRILKESSGDQRRHWMSLFLQTPHIPIQDIEHLVLSGSADISQMSLDYLLRQRRILDLILLHRKLYEKNPELDMTKLARAHTLELIESDQDPLSRLVQLGHEDPQRAVIQEFLISLLTIENAAYDADAAMAVRKILGSAFWRTYTDKLALADALENVSAENALKIRRQKTAALVRNLVFADIAEHIRWAHGQPQEQAKGTGAIQRYDTRIWDRLEITNHNDAEDRRRLRLPWVLADSLAPEENFKGRIHEDLYRKTLEVYQGFRADAQKAGAPALTLLDFEPQSEGVLSDHVFKRLDALTQRTDYIQHLSLHALERFLAMAERPENAVYRERREQIIDRLVQQNSANARFILARAFLKTGDPEVLRLFLAKDAGRLLIEAIAQLKNNAVQEPGKLLLYQQALAKLGAQIQETESIKRLALRSVLDSFSDFELAELSQGRHPAKAMLQNAGIPEAMILSTAGEQLRRHELFWAKEKAAQWEREVTLQSHIFVPGEAALENLEQALGNENLSAERVELALAAGKRDQPRLFRRLIEISEALDAQILKGPEREHVTHIQTWRLSLGFILSVIGFAAGLVWGLFHLTASKAYWPGKKNRRSEMRSVPEGLLKAAASKERFLQEMRIGQELHFAEYERRALQEFGTGLEEILDQMPSTLAGKIPVKTKGSGEILIHYNASAHATGFAAQLSELMKTHPEIRQLTLLKSVRTSAAQWRQFKNRLRTQPGFSTQRILFADELGFESLNALANDRLRARGGLPRTALIQVLEPQGVRERDRPTYDTFLLKAAALGRETILILGNEEPLSGVGTVWTSGEVLETTFQAYALMSKSA